MTKCLLFFVAIIGLIKLASAQDTTFVKLSINRGEFTTIDSLILPALFFNSGDAFVARNAIIEAKLNVPLELALTNNDTVDHTITIGSIASATVRADSDTSLNLLFSEEAIHAVADTSMKHTYLGLSTFIVATSSEYKGFYWNLNEHDSVWTNTLSSGNVVNEEEYQAQYFTINHLSFPATSDDSLSAIKGFVGDTIRINIFNSGLMNHNIHMHGFHASIITSSEFPLHKGRNKDSFGINAGQSLQLEMIAHQPGAYPIHNHNLGATLGNGLYPKGMVSLIAIAP